MRAVGFAVVALLGLVYARSARAQTATCLVDSDCPDTACGGPVCTHAAGGVASCNPANTEAGKGFDGWCADSMDNPVDANCKCRGLGATCAGFFCTFTVPADAPRDAGAAGGSGGSGAGAAGSPGGSTGTAGGGAAGTAATAGAGGGAGGSGRGGGGGGGGCSVADSPRAANQVGVWLLLPLLTLALARRRSTAVRRQ